MLCQDLQKEHAQIAHMEQAMLQMMAGVPSEKTDKYHRLVEAYMDEQTDFTSALLMALAGFPVQTSWYTTRRKRQQAHKNR